MKLQKNNKTIDILLLITILFALIIFSQGELIKPISTVNLTSNENSQMLQNATSIFHQNPELNPNYQTISPKYNVKTPFTGFVENKGQNPDRKILYYFSGKTSFIGFSYSKIDFIQTTNDKNTPFSISFTNSNNVTPTGVDNLQSTTNYFIGNSQEIGLSSFSEIWYYNIYQNIDLRYYISQGGLKYEFIVNPGGNPNDIKLKIENKVHLSVSNSRVTIKSLDTSLSILSESHLDVFQNTNNIIKANFSKINNNEYSFSIGSYNLNIPLIIDPYWLEFSTLLGGSGNDGSSSVKVDNQGNIYLLGGTTSLNFITKSAFNSTNSGENDIFVMKLNPTATKIIYSTYIGGNYYDSASHFSLDKNNDVIIGGSTNSTVFPILNAYQTIPQGNFDGFITELNNTGNGLMFSSFFGGSNYDKINNIVLDNQSNIYITGNTYSINFPTLPKGNGTGSSDVFVSKLVLNTNLTLLFSNLLKGSNDDYGYGIALDSFNNIFVSGYTTSPNFNITLNAYQKTSKGNGDLFLTEFNFNGSTLIYSTYLGGLNYDIGYSLAINNKNDIILMGETTSADFPLVNPVSSSLQSGNAIFISMFNESSQKLFYSTFLTGNNSFPEDLALDSNDNIYLIGETSSSNFPIVNSFNSTFNGYIDAFAMKLSPDGRTINFSTLIGGYNSDYGYGVTTYNSSIYITGSTSSNNFIQINAIQNPSPNTWNGFLSIYNIDNQVPILTVTPSNQNFNNGTTGHTLSWTATDANPGLFFIYKNSSLVDNNNWISGTPINISIDGLNAGSYNYSILVSDKAGLTASNSVFVTVLGVISNKTNPNPSNNTNPVLNSPGDFESNALFGRFDISWVGIGTNASNYIIYENGSIKQSGVWVSGSPIILSDSWSYKAPSNYNLTILIQDKNGNSARNTVVNKVYFDQITQGIIQVAEVGIAAILVINVVATTYELVRKERDYDPESPPDVPAGVSITASPEYMFIGWIGSDTHPIIQWLLNKKIAILLIFFLSFFRIDSKIHIFFSVASETKKNFPKSDSFVYKKKIQHVKSNFRPVMTFFEERLYIAITDSKNKVSLKTLSLEKGHWKLDEESIPIIDPEDLKSTYEPTLTKSFDLTYGKYDKLFFSFYSKKTSSLVIYYKKDGLWNSYANKNITNLFNGSLSSSFVLSEQSNDLIYSWVTKSNLQTVNFNKDALAPLPLPSTLGTSQSTYVAIQDNNVKYGVFLASDNLVQLYDLDRNQNKWKLMKSFKKNTKFTPSITQFRNHMYIVWINKPSPFYFKEFFLATILNNLLRRKIIEYEPLEFEKEIPEDLYLIKSNKTEIIAESKTQIENELEQKSISKMEEIYKIDSESEIIDESATATSEPTAKPEQTTAPEQTIAEKDVTIEKIIEEGIMEEETNNDKNESDKEPSTEQKKISKQNVNTETEK